MFLLSPFFSDDPATTEIYTLSLHDALPISGGCRRRRRSSRLEAFLAPERHDAAGDAVRRESDRLELLRPRRLDRKSTRLNSSHPSISYAVFCLKKKTKTKQILLRTPFHSVQ